MTSVPRLETWFNLWWESLVWSCLPLPGNVLRNLSTVQKVVLRTNYLVLNSRIYWVNLFLFTVHVFLSILPTLSFKHRFLPLKWETPKTKIKLNRFFTWLLIKLHQFILGRFFLEFPTIGNIKNGFCGRRNDLVKKVLNC